MSDQTPGDSAGQPPEAEPVRETGAIIARARRPQIIAAAAVAFLLLATGALLAGVAVGSQSAATAPPEPTGTPGPRSVPPVVPPAVHIRTCSVAELASDPGLEVLHAAVLRLDGDGAELLYGADATSPVTVGGVMKLYTAASALRVLGADFRISTSVVEGEAPGTAVLIARGDPTLSRLPEGQDSFYPGAPKLASLAAQLVDSWSLAHPGIPLTQLVIDTTYWNQADNWNSAWPSDARSAGTMPYIESFMVDGDRDDPTKQTSKRSSDPVARATSAFLDALATADPTGNVVAPGLTVTSGAATSGAALLAEVQSQKISHLIQFMLRTDDNTLAEMLARVISQRDGLDGSMSSVAGVIPSSLTESGIPVDRLTVDDGSGMSTRGQVAPEDLATFLGLIQDGSGGLDVIADSLAVAGESGGLADRFSDSPARGEVSAKTGRNALATAMAGIVQARDGALLAFAVSASRDGVGTGAWAPMDALIEGFYECGSNLAAN